MTLFADHPFAPNITSISDDLAQKALKRTADMLRSLDSVRRALELPIDQLPFVTEIYSKMVLGLMVEADREDLAKRVQRLPLTLRSETSDWNPMKIKRGVIFKVTARPQWLAFRPEDLAIHGERTHWLVHDIKCGNRSQFATKHGPTPGTDFGPDGILAHLRLETLQTAMDLVLDVEYVGPEDEGQVFEATMVGTATT